MLARIHEVMGCLRGHEQSLARLYEEQAQQLRRIGHRLSGQEQASIGVLSITRDTHMALLQTKEMLGQVCQVVAYLQSVVMMQPLVRTLDPTRDMPVLFEDALGNVIPIPMPWIHNWSVSTAQSRGADTS